MARRSLSSQIVELRGQGLEAERLFIAGATARPAANTVVRAFDAGEHLGRLFLIDLLRGEHSVCTDLHTATAADAFLVIDGSDETVGSTLACLALTQ